MVAAAVEAHEAERALLVVTARGRRWEAVTSEWLARNLPAPVARIYMRDDRDVRTSAAVKRDLLRRIRAEGFEPVHALDDEPGVLAIWAEEGIATTRVSGHGEIDVPRRGVAVRPALDVEQIVGQASDLAARHVEAHGITVPAEVERVRTIAARVARGLLKAAEKRAAEAALQPKPRFERGTGWRLWMLVDGELLPPWLTPAIRQTSSAQGPWAPRWNTAVCATCNRAAPQADCVCGIHVVAELRHLKP